MFVGRALSLSPKQPFSSAQDSLSSYGLQADHLGITKPVLMMETLRSQGVTGIARSARACGSSIGTSLSSSTDFHPSPWGRVNL